MLSYKNWKTFNENMMPSFNLGISQPQSMGIMSNSPTTQEMGDETSADTSGQTTDGQSDVAPESGSEETSGDNVEKVLSILKDDELSNKEKAEKIAAMMDGSSESETPEGEAPEGEGEVPEGEDAGADANAPAADTTNQQPTAESYMHGYMHGDDDDEYDDEDEDEDEDDDEDMDDEDMDDDEYDDEDEDDDEDMDYEDMDYEDMDDEDMDEKYKEYTQWLDTVKYDESFFFEAEDQDNIDEDDEDDEVHTKQKSGLKYKIKTAYDKLKNKNWKIPEDNDFKLIFQNKKELTNELKGLSISTLKEILAYFNSQNDQKNKEAKEARAVARANKPKRELTSDERIEARKKADKKRRFNSIKNRIRRNYDKLKKVGYVFPRDPKYTSNDIDERYNFETKRDLNLHLNNLTSDKYEIDGQNPELERLDNYFKRHLNRWEMYSPWGGLKNPNLNQPQPENSKDPFGSGRMGKLDQLYHSEKWRGSKDQHDSEIAKIFPEEEPEKVEPKRRLRTIYNIRREELERERGRPFNYIELEKLKNTYEIEDKLTYLLELYNDHMKETNQGSYGYDWYNPPAETIRSYSRSGGASSGRVQNFRPDKGKHQSTNMTANKYMRKIAALERTIRKCYVCNKKQYKIDMLEVRPDGQPVRYVCPDCQEKNKRATHDPTVGYSPFNTRSVDVDPAVDITHEKPNITPKTKTKTSITDKFDKILNQTKEEVNWWNSIHSMLGHDSNEKHSDGLTNLPEVIKPSAGQVGFAPQGRIGWFQ